MQITLASEDNPLAVEPLFANACADDGCIGVRITAASVCALQPPQHSRWTMTAQQLQQTCHLHLHRTWWLKSPHFAKTPHHARGQNSLGSFSQFGRTVSTGCTRRTIRAAWRRHRHGVALAARSVRASPFMAVRCPADATALLVVTDAAVVLMMRATACSRWATAHDAL